ncbi:hypothetical protein D9758_010894 [Tetrapyrgos nigripes]|uniref:Uncharacterized protein n=1 Tax=Tetrapyrgos nigripes TaxID=182062 RepID=A0A8H5CWK9_9AGAR|nr:hypothetical protein D9758_010894 [Tetrapyrgos nigripes]
MGTPDFGADVTLEVAEFGKPTSEFSGLGVGVGKQLKTKKASDTDILRNSRSPSPKPSFHHYDESQFDRSWFSTSASVSDTDSEPYHSSYPPRNSSSSDVSSDKVSTSDIHDPSHDFSFTNFPLIKEVQDYAISTDSFFAFRRRVHHHHQHQGHDEDDEDDDSSSISSSSSTSRSDSDERYDHGPLLMSPPIPSIRGSSSLFFHQAEENGSFVEDVEGRENAGEGVKSPASWNPSVPSISLDLNSRLDHEKGRARTRRGSMIRKKLGHSLMKVLGHRGLRKEVGLGN